METRPAAAAAAAQHHHHRQNKYPLELGTRGRKTGWYPKHDIRKDEDGFDNIKDFFNSPSPPPVSKNIQRSATQYRSQSVVYPAQQQPKTSPRRKSSSLWHLNDDDFHSPSARHHSVEPSLIARRSSNSFSTASRPISRTSSSFDDRRSSYPQRNHTIPEELSEYEEIIDDRAIDQPRSVSPLVGGDDHAEYYIEEAQPEIYRDLPRRNDDDREDIQYDTPRVRRSLLQNERQPLVRYSGGSARRNDRLDDYVESAPVRRSVPRSIDRISFSRRPSEYESPRGRSLLASSSSSAKRYSNDFRASPRDRPISALSRPPSSKKSINRNRDAEGDNSLRSLIRDDLPLSHKSASRSVHRYEDDYIDDGRREVSPPPRQKYAEKFAEFRASRQRAHSADQEDNFDQEYHAADSTERENFDGNVERRRTSFVKRGVDNRVVMEDRRISENDDRNYFADNNNAQHDDYGGQDDYDEPAPRHHEEEEEVIMEHQRRHIDHGSDIEEDHSSPPHRYSVKMRPQQTQVKSLRNPKPAAPRQRAPKARSVGPSERYIIAKPDVRESSSSGLRKSTRSRIAPLEFWKNERIRYKYEKLEGSVIPLISIDEVIRIDVDEPLHHSTSSNANHQKKKQRVRERSNKPGENVLDQSCLQVLINSKDADGSYVDQQLIISQNMISFMKTSSDFDYAKTQQVEDVGSASTGFMVLQPGGEKPNRNTKANTLAFVVVTGQIEITIHETSVIVGVGTQFIVPAGNQYKMCNRGTQECRIFWVCMTPSAIGLAAATASSQG